MKRVLQSFCESMLNIHAWNGKKVLDEDPDLALWFVVQIRVSNHGYLSDGNTYVKSREAHFHRNIHFIVTSEHRVYYCDKDTLVKAGDFENLSNHDSCWVNAFEKIDDVAYAGYLACFEHEGIPKSDITCYGDKRNNIHIGLGDFTKPFTYVRVKRGPKVDDYRDTLVSFTPCIYTVNIVEDFKKHMQL